MNIDTFSFLIFVLSGFMVVWSFRKSSNTNKSISDFEYLAFSTFWGMIILGLYGWLMRENQELLEKLFANPFAASIFLSLLGLGVGCATGKAWRNWKSRRVVKVK
jgi:predicted transporter